MIEGTLKTAITGRRIRIDNPDAGGVTFYAVPVRRCACSRCTQKRNLDLLGPEHTAWMRGYATALESTLNPTFAAQAAQIRYEYGR